MNKGLELARGDIICFLNADDQYSHSQVLSQVATEMQKFNLDALLGDVGFFYKHNPLHIVRRYRSDRFHANRLAWGWMPAHPGLFLTREVVQRVGQFKTDYRIAGDYEYVVRTFHGHDLHYKHLPSVVVNMQAGGISNSSWRNRLLLNREVVRACKENGIDTNLVKILVKYPFKLLELMF
jgi:glycosyltransferase involved in cell wall biosynthesis